MQRKKQILDFDVRMDGKESALLDGKHPKAPRLNEEVSDKDQRAFYLAVGAILFSFAAFAFFGFNARSSGHQAFVVVDINQLLRQKATEIVKRQTDKKSETQNEIELAEQARRIRGVIDTYARDNNVIVLIKGSAFGANMTEVTDEISMLL